MEVAGIQQRGLLEQADMLDHTSALASASAVGHAYSSPAAVKCTLASASAARRELKESEYCAVKHREDWE